MKLAQKLSKLMPRIRLPSFRITEETVRELLALGGFIMAFIGIWQYDHRIALIVCGIWLMLPPRRPPEGR